MALERTSLNRYTENFIAWIINLKELCKERDDTELIPFIKETLFNAKKVLPPEVLERSGLGKCRTLEDMKNMSDLDFGKICMYFASASIYSTKVLRDTEKNRYIYVASVDNTGLFYPLLMADFLVNTKVFKEADDTPFVIAIMEVKESDDDPFVYLMNTVFKEYYRNVPVEFI